MSNFYFGKIEPSQIFGGCINVFEDVWPDTKQTIADIEDEAQIAQSGMLWQHATTLDGGQDKRTNYDIGITYVANNFQNSVAQNIQNQFYFILLAALNFYKDKYSIHENLYSEPLNLLKYSSGQHYISHYDGPTSTGRSVSAILYLNDEFAGGEIEFVNFNLKIKPKSGTLMIFPSNYAYSHIAHPVTEGTKYALVTWLTDRIL